MEQQFFHGLSEPLYFFQTMNISLNHDFFLQYSGVCYQIEFIHTKLWYNRKILIVTLIKKMNYIFKHVFLRMLILKTVQKTQR